MPRQQINSLLEQMRPIGLSAMKGIKLMNRIDTKFIATERDLVQILAAARGDYRVQEIEGCRVARYDTIYYDTDVLDMYTRHHNQKLTRQKIRTRTYVDTGDVFLEVKNKSNRGRTKKVRTEILPVDFRDFRGNEAACNFIYNRADYSLARLSPHVRTSFERITLVNNRHTERLTIDMGLAFENIRTGNRTTLPGVIIVELKQDGREYSEMCDILQRLRVMPQKISKYCTGTVLTHPGVKANRFKEKLRYIEKLIQK